MEYQVVSGILDHNKLQNNITSQVWDEFMFHDPVSKNWHYLFDYFDKFQISLMQNNTIIGLANCIPYRWDDSFQNLPDAGWDWVFLKGIRDFHEKRTPNVLNALQIVVNPQFQNRGISSMILKEIFMLAKGENFKHVTVPVRPTLKSRYPEVKIEEYLAWTNQDNLPFDPWIRVHVKSGGKILKPCHKAMQITGTIEEWQNWTKMNFNSSGNYIVKGALVPVNIDIKNNLGRYIEPNVWILHDLTHY